MEALVEPRRRAPRARADDHRPFGGRVPSARRRRRGRARRRRPDSSATSTARARRRRCAARSVVSWWGCWSTAANDSARVSRSPGCESPEHARQRSRAGAPRSPNSGSPTPTSKQRIDTNDQWIVERTGIRERRVAGAGRDDRDLAIEAGAAAIKHAGLTPDAIDLLIVATATTGAAHPPHRRVRRRRPRACAAARSTSTPRAPASSTSSSSARRCSTPATSSTSSLIGAETLSRIMDPTDRGTTHPLRRRRRRGGAQRLDRRRRPRAARLGLRLRRQRRRPARDPRRRQSPADDAPRPSPTASTTCSMDGPGGVPSCGAHRRRVGVERARARPGSTIDDVDVVRAAPGEPPHHRGRRQPARHPGGAHDREHRPLRQHRRRRRSRSCSPRRPTTAASSPATSCCCRASVPG